MIIFNLFSFCFDNPYPDLLITIITIQITTAINAAKVRYPRPTAKPTVIDRNTIINRFYVISVTEL